MIFQKKFYDIFLSIHCEEYNQFWTAFALCSACEPTLFEKTPSSKSFKKSLRFVFQRLLFSFQLIEKKREKKRSRDSTVVRALASHQCGLEYGLSLFLILALAPRDFSPSTKTNISKAAFDVKRCKSLSFLDFYRNSNYKCWNEGIASHVQLSGYSLINALSSKLPSPIKRSIKRLKIIEKKCY